MEFYTLRNYLPIESVGLPVWLMLSTDDLGYLPEPV